MKLLLPVSWGAVLNVIWGASKDGYLKPRVQIEPVKLGGVTIEYITGNNAAFIEKHNIGIGALIEIIRSGDVIPKISSITIPAEKPKMPNVDYKWNASHVDILLEDIESNITVKEKNLTGFFRGIGVIGLSGGNISRIVGAGFDTVPKIVGMSKADFLTIDGFKDKLATKIYDGIREGIEKASLVTLMSSSNLLGRGISEKRMAPIMEKYPDILLSDISTEEKVAKITTIEGMAKKTATLFVENIPAFLTFMKASGLESKLVVNESGENESTKIVVNVDNPLYKKSIVMTGVRDDDIKDNAKKYGYKLSTSVSKNTFKLIAKSTDEQTGKSIEARKLGIPIVTVDDFKTMYFSQ